MNTHKEAPKERPKRRYIRKQIMQISHYILWILYICLILVLVTSGRSTARKIQSLTSKTNQYSNMIVIYNDVCDGIKKLNQYESAIQIHRDNVTNSSFELKSSIYDLDNEILRQSYASNNEVIRRVYEETIHPYLVDNDYETMVSSVYTMKTTYPDAIDYTKVDEYLSIIDEINETVTSEKDYCNTLIDSYQDIVDSHRDAFSEVKFNPRSYEKYK